MKKFFSKFSELFIEYGIYIYIIIMFLNKGESIKNIALYGAFGLWLFSGKWRDKALYRHPVTLVFGAFLMSVLLSVVFSIDPAYSFGTLLGDELKAVLLFLILATSFSSEKKLKGLLVSLCISAAIMISIGFYSYLTQNLPFLTAKIELMYAWHNRFARYLCLTTPFAAAVFLISKSWINRALLLSLILSGAIAIVLSTSRGGMLSSLLIVAVWLFFIYKRKSYDLRKITPIITGSFLFIIVFGLVVSPTLKTRITNTENVINLRLPVWHEAIEAAKKRPIFGWGTGGEIFHRPEPHSDPSYKSPTKAGPENMFISILFHQGIVGLFAYIALIATALAVFFRSALKAYTSLRSFVLVTICGIIVGNYIGHSFFAVDTIRGLAILIGIGVAVERIGLGEA